MRKEHSALVLVFLFFFVCALRLTLSFQTPLPDHAAYDSLRQVESIHDKGIPLYEDELSFGGKNRLFAPLYYYVLSLFSLVFSPLLVVKVVPNLLAASVVFPVYSLTRMMTNSRVFALFGAFFAGTIPSMLLQGINDSSTSTLSIPLFFTAAYLFLKSRKSGKHLNYLFLVLVVLSLVDNIGLIFLISLLLFIALLSIERIAIRPKEIEVLLFYLFFSGWVILIMYKQAFQAHGSAVIWQNIPFAELSTRFSDITLIGAIAATGLVPLIAGVWGLYHSSTRTKRKSCYLMMSVIIASVVLLWFRLVPLGTGLILLSISLSVMSGYSLMHVYQALRKTRTPYLSPLVIGAIILLFILTSTPQYLAYTTDASEEDVILVLSERQELLGQATIMGVPQEGSLISYVTGARNVIDQDYLLTPRVDERYDDVLSLYRSKFLLPVVETMTTYGATHLLITETTRRTTGVQEFVFLEEHCFTLVSISRTAALYELTCSVRERAT